MNGKVPNNKTDCQHVSHASLYVHTPTDQLIETISHLRTPIYSANGAPCYVHLLSVNQSLSTLIHSETPEYQLWGNSDDHFSRQAPFVFSIA